MKGVVKTIALTKTICVIKTSFDGFRVLTVTY